MGKVGREGKENGRERRTDKCSECKGKRMEGEGEKRKEKEKGH